MQTAYSRPSSLIFQNLSTYYTVCQTFEDLVRMFLLIHLMELEHFSSFQHVSQLFSILSLEITKIHQEKPQEDRRM
jgi:hypothetical protein